MMQLDLAALCRLEDALSDKTVVPHHVDFRLSPALFPAPERVPRPR
jgi:hypothetical protein